MPCLLAQEIRHLKAAKTARDQELADALKQLDAERAQVQELERSLLSQVHTFGARQRAQPITVTPCRMLVLCCSRVQLMDSPQSSCLRVF